jgi:hypothetical protein
MLLQEGPDIPVPQSPMPTTMLLRLVVVPLRLVIVALPLVVLPARLKVSGAPECATVGKADSVTVPLGDVPPQDGAQLDTVVAGEVGMPLLVLVTTIPEAAQVLAVLATGLTVLLLVVQVPVVVQVVGSVYWALVLPLLGPTASELPVKVRFALEEIVICEELLTLLTVVGGEVGIPCPYISIPGWMAEVLGKMPEIVVLPLVVFPVIGVTGIKLSRRSLNTLPLWLMWLQLVALVQKLSPTLTVVT